MKVNIQFVSMPTSEAMERYTTEKLQKMARKHEWLIHADVFFKREKDPKGNGRICEMELSLPGPRIFASSNEKNYELAVKNTISDLQKQLTKRKELVKSHT